MLYLHCGWPRTGTSSLQAALHRSRDLLADQGIVFPDRWRRNPSNPTHNGISHMVRQSFSSPDDAFDPLRRFLELNAEKRVILSAEALTTSLMVGEGTLRLLAAIRDVTPTRCIWSLRRADELAISVYLLKLRNHEMRPVTEHMRTVGPPDRLFSGMRAAEEAVGGDAVYVGYKRSGAHNDALLRALDIPLEISATIQAELGATRLNQSLTHKQATVLANRDAIGTMAGVELDAHELRKAFNSGFHFEQDRPCEPIDYTICRKLHRRALDAAGRQEFLPYARLFGDAEIGLTPYTPLHVDAITNTDLTHLMDHLNATPSRSDQTRCATR